MRDKFALQDTHHSMAGDSGCEARMYLGVVDCGTGPVVLRLCIWVNGRRFNDDTFKAEAYGPASWVFEMMPAKTQGKGGVAKRRGMGETGGMSVTFDQAWDLLESYGLPAHYSFA